VVDQFDTFATQRDMVLPALLMTSPLQTAGHKMAAVVPLSSVFVNLKHKFFFFFSLKINI